MYLRSEVSTDEEMKVSGISRLWLRNGKNVITETRADVGLWQVSADAREWAQLVGAKLEEKRVELDTVTLDRSDVLNVYWDNREYVADDPMILRRVLRLSQSLNPVENGCIFTQDIALAKMCANRSGMTFYRISPSVLLSLIEGKDARRECLEFDMNPALVWQKLKLPGHPVKISIVDTGSLDAMLMEHEQGADRKTGKSVISRRTQIDYGVDRRGRFEVFSVRKIKPSSLTGIYDHMAKDNLGRTAYDTYRPQKTIRTKVPKFESYRGSEKSGKTLTGFSEREIEDFRKPLVPSDIY